MMTNKITKNRKKEKRRKKKKNLFHQAFRGLRQLYNTDQRINNTFSFDCLADTIAASKKIRT